MKIILPLSVTLPRKKGDKIWICNLNNYRNTHFQVLNQVKIAYALKVKEAVKGMTMKGDLLIFQYMIFPSSKRSFDLSNVCSVIDKFTCDALITEGIIKDDNYKNIKEVIYRFGEIDKENPRCELIIYEPIIRQEGKK